MSRPDNGPEALTGGNWRLDPFARIVRYVITAPPEPVQKVRPIPQPCGTPAAYRRHLYNGEQSCAECKRASAERRKQLRQRKAA